LNLYHYEANTNNNIKPEYGKESVDLVVVVDYPPRRAEDDDQKTRMERTLIVPEKIQNPLKAKKEGIELVKKHWAPNVL